MLKKRLIATLIVREGIVVQSIQFKRYLPIGKPEIAVEFLNLWGIDEIIVLDISASKCTKKKKYDYVERMTESCFVPLTVGGGINSLEDIHYLLNLGADKICINHHCLQSPQFIGEAAKVFGKQCIVVSIDVRGDSRANYRIYDAARTVTMNIDLVDWAREVEEKGAGEIYLTSVERDGTKRGMDLELINTVADGVGIPVIASGGVGNPGHILDVFSNTNASAASAANLFHFSEHSVITTKSILRNSQITLRLNTNADYSGSTYDEYFRLNKRSDDYLYDLLFKRIQKEVI